MKRVILLLVMSFVITSCNMNPSKEARIQKLESEIQQAMDKIGELEKRALILERDNEELNARISRLENQ